jgi:hypothetical protein
MNLQAHLPATLAAVHNFICDLDPNDLNNFREAEDVQPGWRSGDLAEGIPHRSEREQITGTMS